MSGYTPPRRRTSPGRAFRTLRVPDLLSSLHAAVEARRRRMAERFHGPSDWLRLVVLGSLLITLALPALVGSIPNLKVEGYSPGMASMFGGLLLAIIIVRIGRPAIYFDWIAVGLLYVGIGVLLSANPWLSPVRAFVLFCLLFTASALLRTWIGVTLDARGSDWLTANGLTALFCVAWAIGCRVMAASRPSPDVIVAVDLMLTGLSIAGFGLSLRGRPA